MTDKTELLQKILPKLRIVKGPDSRGEHVAWCPFHPDGQGKPPHQANLYVSERGYICHACGAKGGLFKLAKELGMEMTNQDMNIEALYNYQDETGKILYQVVRKAGKKFLVRCPDGKGDWIWNIKGVKKVLYKLPNLLKRQDELVFVVEGEKDADRLHQAGLLATTNPHGAGKWKSAYSKRLKDRDVVIIPDNDELGRKHAQQVAQFLHGKAKSIKVVELPDLPEHGDISDWLDAGNTVDKLTELVQNAAPWFPSDKQKANNSGNEEKKQSRTDKLVDIILSTDIALFRDQHGQPYARIRLEKGHTCIPVKSQEFENWISGIAWKTMDWSIGTEALKTTKRTLEFTARFNGPIHVLSVRVASHEKVIWVDLDGYKAVRITREGWQIIDDPPILFRNFAHQQPLPFPAKTAT